MSSRLFLFLILLCVCWIPTTWEKKIPAWHLKMVQMQGPNTCAVEEVPGSKHKLWTECKYWLHREICGVQSIIRYECCEGFQMVADEPGCSSARPVLNLVDTALEQGATLFVDYLIRSGLDTKLRQANEAVTLFVPSNQAFEEIKAELYEKFEAEAENPGSPYLLYHMVERRVHLENLTANHMVDTLNKGKKLRINQYSNKISTVNCIPILRKDIPASNGVIHLIDSVLEPPADNNPSLPELIFADGRFREFSRLLIQSDLISELRSGSSFTIFAPSDEAFHKLSPIEYQRITGVEDIRKELLEAHIVAQPLCVNAVIEKHIVDTLGGPRLELNCNVSGVYLDSSKVELDTMIASNGIVSMVSDIIMPSKARSIMEHLEGRENLSVFVSLLKSSQLQELLTLNNNLTLFVPNDLAFEQLPAPELDGVTSDMEVRKELLKNHIVSNYKLRTNGMSDNQMIETMRSNNFVRIKVYRQAFGVEAALIQEADIEGFNGIIHIIDKVLMPAHLSIVDTLNEKYSLFSEAIRRVQDQEPDFLSNFNYTYTVFAPSDEAFKDWGIQRIEDLMDNHQALKQLIQNHIVDNMFASKSFVHRSRYRIWTESHQQVNVQYTGDHLRVNDAQVTEPDIVTIGGVVHCIDKVLDY